jgi:predicted alpha/beta hydrolase
MLDAQWEDEHLGPRKSPIEGESVRFCAADGYELGGTLRRARDPRGALVVAGAMAVAEKRYGKLSAYFASQGFHTLTFDYRGVGRSRPRSLRGFRARLHEWGELDLTAALSVMDEIGQGLPSFFLGHSVGGQLFGLAPPGRVRAAVFYASQSGYFGHWSGTGRAVMATLWHAVVPALSRTWGYLPMRTFGQGDDVPAGVALEWARWGKDPKYILQWADAQEKQGFEKYRGRVRAYAFTDDPYAPKRAVEALLEAYEGATKDLTNLSPRDVGLPKIGHFAPLREAYREALWAPARDYFLQSLEH